MFKKLCLVLFVCSFFTFINKAYAALNIFNISPSVINSPDDVVTIAASASGLQNSKQYLEVAFTKEGETASYFGLTKNLSEEWYQYKSSPTTSDLNSYFYSFTPVGGTWSGQLMAKIDISDSGFKGAGNYIVKLNKFITSSGSFSNNSVTVAVNVTLTPVPPTAISIPQNTSIPASTSMPTPTKTPTPSPSKSPTVTTTKTPTPSASPTSANGSLSPTINISPTGTEGEVLGTSTSKFPFVFIALGLIFLVVCGILSYFQFGDKIFLWKK